jgi:hypothetical protein
MLMKLTTDKAIAEYFSSESWSEMAYKAEKAISSKKPIKNRPNKKVLLS